MQPSGRAERSIRHHVAGRALALGAGLVGLMLVAAGCGGSKTPSVASLSSTASASGQPPTSTAGSSTARKPSRAAFAECLTSHGFAASEGSAGSASARTISIFGVQVAGNVDPGSAQFQTAMQACRKFLPGGGPPAMTPAQQAEAAKANLGFAACMRKNGVPSFPDPNGQGMFPFGSLSRLDPNSPLVQTAFKACEVLEPKVGPRLRL